MRKILTIIILFSIFLNAQKNRDTKYLYMDIERVNIAHQNILAKIIYKNISRVFIKVVNSSNTKVIRDINISIPPTNDDKKHSIEVSLGNYNLGEYVFVFSTDIAFQKEISYKSITISNLAYFYKNSELLIVNRESGVPIEGAKVTFYKENRKSIITTIKSDKSGLVKIPQNLDKYYIQIEYKKDKLRVPDILHHIKEEKNRNKSIEEIYFFTDKDIYKPNDNIKFKAILVKKFQNKKSKVISNRKIVIRLLSDNKKLGDKILKSDDFGAIYGSFDIPKNIIGDIKLSSKLGNKTITIQKVNSKPTKKEKEPPHQKYLWHKLDKKSYSVGSTATLYIKSPSPHTKVLFNLIRNNQILKEEWIDINGSTKKSIPITKDDRGDIFYSLTMMRDNKKYIDYGVIKVPWGSDLKVDYINFRDKVKANSQEEYKIKVTNKNGVHVDAQMVAYIYKSSNSTISKNLYPHNYIGKYTIWDSAITNSSRYIQKSNISNSILFKPNLQTDKNSNIIINFKTNKSPNHWNFFGFVHTKDLKTAIIQKELTITSNQSKSVKKHSDKQINTITKNRVLYIKPKEKKTFILQELKDINLTQKRYRFTIEFTSNPSWFALQAMPYILEYPDNNSSEEIFNKYFINNIASKLIVISPQIEKIFKNWRDEKDKKVAKIFNSKELIDKRKLYYHKLQKVQNSDGGWSLSDDNKSNWQTTQYIVKGFTKLKEIGIDKTNTKMLSQAIKFIDKQVSNEYQKLKDNNRLQKDNLNGMIIDYLYIRTFYDFPILSKEGYRYYLNQIKKYWSNKTLYEQATIALTLNKKLAKEDSIKILKSIKNSNMIYNQFSIATYTQIIKLFDTLSKDKKMVELMKVWLLKNRQNSHWKTTKDTQSAIYALLRDNAWIINSSKLVEIKFPNSKIDYKSIIEEAKTHTQKGIEYFQVSFDKVDKSMATVEINNPNNNSVWGVFSLQYFK